MSPRSKRAKMTLLAGRTCSSHLQRRRGPLTPRGALRAPRSVRGTVGLAWLAGLWCTRARTALVLQPYLASGAAVVTIDAEEQVRRIGIARHVSKLVENQKIRRGVAAQPA